MSDIYSDVRRDPNPKDFRLKEADEWIAECQSLSPDLSLGIHAVGTGWDALCLIYLLSHISHLYWITDDITRKIAQKAYSSNYEGEWEIVQQMLELDPKTPRQFYEQFLQDRSPEEFFGNLKRRARRLIRIIKFKKRDPHGPVRVPQRKRGYNDKGTYVPPHRPRVEPPEKVTRVDRRKKVGHVLLFDPDEET